MAPVSDTGAARGRRTHPASALVRVWLWLVAALAGSVNSIAGERPSLRTVLVLAGAIVLGVLVGLASWWFTTFVIDGHELRIDSGILTKRSRRVPYERLQSVDIAQPFGARIFGLAELRIEMAGGGDSLTRLQFLTVPAARELRSILLGRAEAGPADGALVGAGGSDPADARPGTPGPARGRGEVIATVSPTRLVLATLVSLDFVVAAVVFVLLLVGAAVAQGFGATLSLTLPFGAWAGGIVMRRVIAQWGSTLSRTDRGLRIERGLLGRVSQTIPLDRVQGMAVLEPLVWRPMRWKRLDVDVAGYAGGEEPAQAATSTALPVGTAAQAERVLAAMLPGIEPATVPTTPAPRRSRWLAPVGWRYRAAGADARGFVARSGWVVHRTDVVPNHKTQSVALRQGPLQRRLTVATLEVHTPDGPVNAKGRNLDANAARELGLAQVRRAREARGAV